MAKLNLEKNGVEIIKINKSIRSIIINDIRKNIAEKLNLKKNSTFLEISKYLNNMNDLTFNSLFGNVATRYLSYRVTKKINDYIKDFKLDRKYRNVFLHQMTPLDLKENKNLKK